MARRRAGVLLHITSLPGPYAYGDISLEAYKFIDQISAIGFSVWQILPLGPTHDDLCPYQSLSAHAGNPQLINLEWLCERNWLTAKHLINNGLSDREFRNSCIRIAYHEFKKHRNELETQRFEDFVNENNYWLENYALYTVLRTEFANKSWMDWPAGYRDGDESLLNDYKAQQHENIEAVLFQQYVFFSQWAELKYYVNQKGILIIGDMPIFVSHDSADVWANKKYFAIDENGQAEFVAGVPPDYFSESGQRWGNPHYQWDKLKEDQFTWWVERIQTQTKLYDALRIDHFRGLSKYWEIPANEENAVNGRWVDAPGKELLHKLQTCFPDFSLVAEDLGTITPDVLELRDEFSLPGMLILQFAFDGSADNPYLLKNHHKNSLVYTATHDNDTTLGWYHSLPPETKQYVDQYVKYSHAEMPWALIHVVFDSMSNLAIIPMQDLLELGDGHRMNMPGTIENNWQWRYQGDQFSDDIKNKITLMIKNSNRAVASSTYSSTQAMQPNSNL